MSFIRSGYYLWYYGALNDRRSYGRYWSSRAYSGTLANNLYFYGSSIYPRSGNNRGSGYAVRCGGD